MQQKPGSSVHIFSMMFSTIVLYDAINTLKKQNDTVSLLRGWRTFTLQCAVLYCVVDICMKKKMPVCVLSKAENSTVMHENCMCYPYIQLLTHVTHYTIRLQTTVKSVTSSLYNTQYMRIWRGIGEREGEMGGEEEQRESTIIRGWTDALSCVRIKRHKVLPEDSAVSPPTNFRANLITFGFALIRHQRFSRL